MVKPGAKQRRIKPEAKQREHKHEAHCNVCGRSFGSCKQLLRHHEVIHQNMTEQCTECGDLFMSSGELANHRVICGQQQQPAKKQKPHVGSGHRTAPQENTTVELFTPTNNQDILAACVELVPEIVKYLKDKVAEHPVKWCVNMHAFFMRPLKDNNTGLPTDEF